MEITASSLTIGYAFTHAIHARARDRDLFLGNRTERRKTRGQTDRARKERGGRRERERDRRYSGPRRRIQEEKRTYTRARTRAHVRASYVPRAIIQAAITRSCRVHPFSGEFFLLPFPPTPSPLSPSGPSSISPVSSALPGRLAGDQPFFFANCHAVTVVISSYPPGLNVRGARVCAHVVYSVRAVAHVTVGKSAAARDARGVPTYSARVRG